MQPTNAIKAISLKVASALIFAVMSALVRYLGTDYPVGQVVFFRSAFAIVPVVVIYAWRRELEAAVRMGRPLGHAGRGLTAVGGMFCNFSALARLPIVDSTAISFASPLITVAMAALVLKERVRIYRWSAVIVGFVGVLVMLLPHLRSAGTRRAGPSSRPSSASGFAAVSRISCSPRATAGRRHRWWRRSTTHRCCGRSCSAIWHSASCRPRSASWAPPSSRAPDCS
jgi:drug/metabolite transporter (DMT)-like permease